jgi:hypothetical protein
MHLNICMLYDMCVRCYLRIYVVYGLYAYNIIFEFIFTFIIGI